jgi:hypothetical protein
MMMRSDNFSFNQAIFAESKQLVKKNWLAVENIAKWE